MGSKSMLSLCRCILRAAKRRRSFVPSLGLGNCRHSRLCIFVISILLLSLLLAPMPAVEAAFRNTGRVNGESSTAIEGATIAALPPCVAFSPYVNGYDPERGPHPPAAVIDALLDALLQQSTVKCIQVYGVLNGLDH